MIKGIWNYILKYCIYYEIKLEEIKNKLQLLHHMNVTFVMKPRWK